MASTARDPLVQSRKLPRPTSCDRREGSLRREGLEFEMPSGFQRLQVCHQPRFEQQRILDQPSSSLRLEPESTRRRLLHRKTRIGVDLRQRRNHEESPNVQPQPNAAGAVRQSKSKKAPAKSPKSRRTRQRRTSTRRNRARPRTSGRTRPTRASSRDAGSSKQQATDLVWPHGALAALRAVDAAKHRSSVARARHAAVG